jgi:hypothetical protein
LRSVIMGRKAFTAACNCAGLGVVIATLAVCYVERSSAAQGDTVADDTDRVEPYVADQETYDNNLYKQPSYINVATLISPNASRQDHINTAYAGMDAQWTLAQQTIGLNLRVNDNRFARNYQLNNNSGNADLLWNWRLGSNLSGEAGGDYTHSLANFAETLYLGRDLVDVTDYYGTARYQLGPRWAVYGGIREADTSHSAVAAQQNDSQIRSGKAGIEYATAVDNTIGWEYRYAEAHYPYGEYLLNGVPFNPDYSQNTASFLVKYVLTDKTTINASVGYLKRYYTYEPIGAFSGDIWNLSVQWQATEKTNISFTASRALQAYLTSQSDYYVATGGSISPVWVASEKLRLSLTVSSFNQNYITTSPSGVRHDRINTQQASIAYGPMRDLIINVSYSYLQRNSNQAQYTFDDKLATAALTFKF